MVCVQSGMLINSESSFGALIEDKAQLSTHNNEEHKMKRVATLIAWVVVAMAGCTTGNPAKTHPPTVDQMIVIAEKMVDMMITDGQFLNRSYPRVKKLANERGESLPTITVERFKADCHKKLMVTDYALTPVRDSLKVALRKTDMFFVEDEESSTMDYGLSGELISSDDGRQFFLRLRLYDYGDGCKEIWNEFKRVEVE